MYLSKDTGLKSNTLRHGKHFVPPDATQWMLTQSSPPVVPQNFSSLSTRRIFHEIKEARSALPKQQQNQHLLSEG